MHNDINLPNVNLNILEYNNLKVHATKQCDEQENSEVSNKIRENKNIKWHGCYLY